MNKTRKLKHLLMMGSLLAMLIVSAPMSASALPQTGLDANTQFYVPKPNHGALDQIADLTSSGNKADANLIKEMIGTPQAVWFTQGTPKTVMQDVRNTVQRAADKGQVPVLVAYNIPFRDCAQYCEHHLARGRTRVHVFRQRNEIHAQRLKVFQSAEQMGYAPGKPIETPHRHDLETAAMSIGH